MNREPRQGTAQDMENTLIGLNRRLAKAEAALEAVAMSPNPICTGETGHPKPCDCVGDIVRAALRRDVCGIAPVAITSTNEATHRTAKAALPTEGHLLLEWESLSAESQNKVSKWFQLATEHLQGILDAPAISRPPTQGSLGTTAKDSTTMATAPGDLSDGYHTFKELYEHRHALFSVICARFDGWKSKRHADGTMFDDSFIAGVDTPLGPATYHMPLRWWDRFRCEAYEHAPIWDGHTAADVPRRIAALAEGQQSSELVEKTPSALPGERE